jgi:ABC-2 type transport system permease protein
VSWRPIWAVMRRELVRMVRQRGRLVSALVRPLIWLLIIGAGFEALLGRMGPEGYRQFLVPGLTGMVLLFGAMLASLSLVYDKESGVVRLLLVAPFARGWIIVARTLSAAVVATVQALLLLLVLIPLGYFPPDLAVTWLIPGLLATALACAALGMLIAVWSPTLDNFAVVMNFVIFPVFFLSGALYPVQQLPVWLHWLAAINPFTYGVDLLKHAMNTAMAPPFGPDFPALLDLAVLIAFTAAATAIAAYRFSRRVAA